MTKAAFFVILFYFTLSVNAQVDTLSPEAVSNNQTEYQHITKRAAIWSAVIPGAGQIYNEIGYRRIPQKKHRAWWKVPIIYGGLGACGYYFYQNNKLSALLKQEYLFRQDNPTASYLDERFIDHTEAQLITDFDFYSKRRDYLIVGFIGVWGLNVIEAYVDAHFVTFDVSEDLSLSWAPSYIGGRYPGLSLQMNFN